MEITTNLVKKDGKSIYSIKSSNGYFIEYELRPGQLEVIEIINKNFMDNIMFVAPTAYGKTIGATHYIIEMYNNGFKSLYSAPLKSGTAEMSSLFNKLGFKVLEDTGDYRKSPKKDYNKADIVIATTERLDSVIRNPGNHSYFDVFGLLVVDEIHNIQSKNRGVNLESMIIKIKQHTGLAIMAMSATVDNYNDVASFLNAKTIFVPSKDRPIIQKIKILYYFSKYQRASITERNNILLPILHSLIKRKKQALIFCSSRDRCESLAKYFSGYSTRDPILMARKSNYTWHHSDLEVYQKKEIEKMFLTDQVRFIFCTPTLAMSVNLPAFSVIIYDTCRWNGLISDWELIESLEIEQMVGRAGRPQFGEKECEVYIFSRIEDKPYVFEENIIISKLNKNLKAVLNEWINSDITNAEELKTCLLEESLVCQQVDKVVLKKEGGNALKYLLKNGFISRPELDTFMTTFLGRITALFYIQPETALHFKQVEQVYESSITDLELTAMLLNNDEFLQMIQVKKKDMEVILLCSKEFNEIGIPSDFYDERILKAMPMLFTNYFNKKYSVRIIVYRPDLGKLNGIMQRLFSSAEIIISNIEIKKRIGQLKIMIKSRTLNREVAILKSVRGIGDIRLKRLFDAGIIKTDHFFRRSDSDLMRIMKITKLTLNSIREELKKVIKENERM